MDSKHTFEETCPPWESKGRKLRQWMNGHTNDECKIPRTLLTFADLEQPPWTAEVYPECLPKRETTLTRMAGVLPFEILGVTRDEESVYRKVSIVSNLAEPTIPGSEWYGYSGPGMLSISWIFRPQEDFVLIPSEEDFMVVPSSQDDGRPAGEPYASEIAKAVYEKDFPLETLKFVFVTQITNNDTKDCINLYLSSDSESNMGLSCPYGSPTFDAVLGTRIGSLVAYLILCAYGQGVKRVGKILLDSLPGQTSWDLRFDIENVPRY